MKVYSNGKILEKDDLREVFEPGFLFGWGAFEALRTYDRKPAFLNLHIERLTKSLGLLGIEAPDIDFKEKIEELGSLNSLDDAYVRITVYKKRKGSGTLIYADKFGYYPPAMYEKGFSAVISPYSRNTHGIFSRLKTLSYVESRMSWYQAQKVNKDEALILSLEGFLVGGARSNVFFIKDRRVFTPSVLYGAFPGITKKKVVQILEDLKLEVCEKKLTVDELFGCQEAFLTSSLLEVMPLVECEGKVLGKGAPGEISRQVAKRYRKIVQSKN
ncbi:MAG: aminotransferase class IV [Candidatus Omnitrophota bacterium]|nr:MAG: aminotransferase class IV [Candidatus Omnitrophota bacterium]